MRGERMRIGTKLTVMSAILSAALGALAFLTPALGDFNSAAKDWRDGKFTAAFNEFKSLAEVGHPQAQYNLSQMYLHGNGPAQSFQMAYGWMSVAAAYGLAEAQAQIKEWAGQATGLDRKRAQLLLGQFGPGAVANRLLPKPTCSITVSAHARSSLRPDELERARIPDESIPITGMVLTNVYVAPDGRARDVRVVEAFPRGVFELPVIEALMRSRFRTATRDGAPSGGWVLQRYGFHPIGPTESERDVRSHLHMLMKKARNGDVPAQYIAGMTQRYWLRSKQSSGPVPIELIEQAAAAGLPEAQDHLGRFLLTSRCEGQEDLARYWVHQAAVGGNTGAQVWLGHALIDENDPARTSGAIFWLDRAAKTGDISARRMLAAVLLQPGAGQDAKRALELAEHLSTQVAYDPSGPLLRAGAHALLGDFPNAESAQREALDRARQLHWDTGPLEAALENYRGKRTPTGRLVDVGSAQELIRPRPPPELAQAD